MHTLVGHNGRVTAVTWSPDGKHIATSSADGSGIIWDFQSGATILHILVGHNGPVTSVTWSPDGNRIATASFDCTAKIWDLSMSQELSFKQNFFLALVNHYYQRHQPVRLDDQHEHLRSIYNSLPADIQKSISNKIIIEEINPCGTYR